MKIVVTGTRGIPDILGGVEKHCEELYPRLVHKGHQVVLFRRKNYVPKNQRISRGYGPKRSRLKIYRGIVLKDLLTLKVKSAEAFIHTFFAVVYARVLNPDILHIHAIGPGLMVPLARLLGLKVVVTNHGPDYNRQKWGHLAKFILRLGENLGTRFANQVIAISVPIRETLERNYHRNDIHLIFNGVNIPIRSPKAKYLESLGIKPWNYLLAVGRFVEEKGFIDLITAWRQLPNELKPQLVIAGDADHETCYSRGIKKHAEKYGVILTGFVKGEELNQLYSYAQLFVMPSYHEGLPIALLEAMSYGLDVVVSDIQANLEVGLDRDCYFKTGDKLALSRTIQTRLELNHVPDYSYLLKKYNWDTIAQQTEAVYQSCLNKSRSEEFVTNPIISDK